MNSIERHSRAYKFNCSSAFKRMHKVCVILIMDQSTPNAHIKYAVAYCGFFSWFHDTVYGPTNTKNAVLCRLSNILL